MNATAALHDYWFNDGNPNRLEFTAVNNIGTMPVAAVITMAAVIGNVTQGYNSNPAIVFQLAMSGPRR